MSPIKGRRFIITALQYIQALLVPFQGAVPTGAMDPNSKWDLLRVWPGEGQGHRGCKASRF